MDRNIQKKLSWGIGTGAVALIAIQTSNAAGLLNCMWCDRDRCKSLDTRVLERKPPECDCRFGHYQTEWTPWAANCDIGGADCQRGSCGPRPTSLPRPGWSDTIRTTPAQPHEYYSPSPAPHPGDDFRPYLPPAHSPSPSPYSTYESVPSFPPGYDSSLPLAIPPQPTQSPLPPIENAPPPIQYRSSEPSTFAPVPSVSPPTTYPLPSNSVPMNAIPMNVVPMTPAPPMSTEPMNEFNAPTRSSIPGEAFQQRRMPVQPTGHWQQPSDLRHSGQQQFEYPQSTPPGSTKWRVMPGYNGAQSQQPIQSQPFYPR